MKDGENVMTDEYFDKLLKSALMEAELEEESRETDMGIPAMPASLSKSIEALINEDKLSGKFHSGDEDGTAEFTGPRLVTKEEALPENVIRLVPKAEIGSEASHRPMAMARAKAVDRDEDEKQKPKRAGVISIFGRSIDMRRLPAVAAFVIVAGAAIYGGSGLLTGGGGEASVEMAMADAELGIEETMAAGSRSRKAEGSQEASGDSVSEASLRSAEDGAASPEAAAVPEAASFKVADPYLSEEVMEEEAEVGIGPGGALAEASAAGSAAPSGAEAMQDTGTSVNAASAMTEDSTSSGTNMAETAAETAAGAAEEKAADTDGGTMTGIANPMKEVASISDIEAELAISMQEPKGASELRYYVIGGSVGEISYTSASGYDCTYRASRDAKEDISGIYYELKDKEELEINGSMAELAFADETAEKRSALIKWELDGVSYSLYMEGCSDRDSAVAEASGLIP